eukprot:3875410-Pyramimonas_sp.AAC.1
MCSRIVLGGRRMHYGICDIMFPLLVPRDALRIERGRRMLNFTCISSVSFSSMLRRRFFQPSTFIQEL